MELSTCPACGALLDAAGLSRCPACGAALEPPVRAAASDYVIDVTARAEDGEAVGAAAAERTEVSTARAPQRAQEDEGPFFEQRRFAGRMWPGGPAIAGRTIIFRSGGTGPQDGTGCCACGCLIMAVMGLIFLRGCATFFH